MNLSLKQKIIGAIVIIGTILILIFQAGFYPKPTALENSAENVAAAQTDNPELISTSPSPLEKAILWGTQPFEVTFNLPLENIPELKYKLEPDTDIKVELSDDKKTVRFIPTKPLPLGVEYTLTIPGEAKFEGKKILGKSYTFRFKTIEYRGV